jgi:glycerol kinase
LTRNERYILAIDQGTTRTKAAIFDRSADLKGLGFSPIPRTFPQPGWVEQEPEAIWRSVLIAVRSALKAASCSPQQIAAVGIDDQGETVVMWDRRSGRPLYNAIVWQCRRTATECDQLKKEGYGPTIRRRTGLVIDPYFSATKIRWILDHVRRAKKLARAGQAVFGTTDTWVIWKITGGRYFVTDCSTASRTSLFNIHKMKWDDELLQIFRIPQDLLAEVHENSGDIAHTNPSTFLGIDAPISGLIVDQQSALFGHGCFREGEFKNTYGTGCFLLMNTGHKPRLSKNNLLTTVAWTLGGERSYALDGGVYVAGSAIDWLVKGLGVVSNPAKTSEIAASIPSNDDVYFVPAFVGLAAPYWDSYARGTVVGLSDRSTKAHIVRATLESIAYQVNDVLSCMEADSGTRVKKLRADGGPTANKFLMQFQANISGIPVEIPQTEVTALGAALLAGLGVDFWDDLGEVIRLRKKRIYKPRMSEGERIRLSGRWKKAVSKARKWTLP